MKKSEKLRALGNWVELNWRLERIGKEVKTDLLSIADNIEAKDKEIESLKEEIVRIQHAYERRGERISQLHTELEICRGIHKLGQNGIVNK